MSTQGQARSKSKASVAPPVGTITFLFSDIEGSTSRWETRRTEMQSAVARHEQLMIESVARHRGYVFKTLGDALCVAFPTAPEALRAAVDAQRALAMENFSAVDGLRVRMGLHTGHADERNADYFGPAVNRVSRIMGIGHGGQVLVSDVTHGLACSDLPDGATFLDLGFHRLKDLKEAEHVWQLSVDPLPAKFPPLKSLGVAKPGTVIRQALLDRLSSTRPHLVALFAPAGFGKSTLATQFASHSERYAVCDCRGADTAALLAQRILGALGEERPELSTELSRRQLLFRDAGALSESYLQVVVESWSANPPESVFVFENVERIDGKNDVLELLWRLLATMPPSRTAVICSRVPLRVRLTRFAPPHAIALLRPRDLAFDQTEIKGIFEGLNVDDAALEAIAAQSRGWPVAVLLFARFQREGRLRELLDRVSSLAFEELYEYLANEVLETLPPYVVEALVACAFIPQPSMQEVAAAIGELDIEEKLRDSTRDLPFVTLNPEGTLEIHPLVGTMLREANQSRGGELLARAARVAETTSDWIRAALLHIERGAKHDAAVALSAVNFSTIAQRYTIEYTTLLSKLDFADILRSPTLWYATVHERRFRTDLKVLLDEAAGLYRSLETITAPVGRIAAGVFYALFLSDSGQHAEGERVMRELAQDLAIPEILTDNFHGSVVHIRAALLARMGRLTDARTLFDRAAQVIGIQPISVAISAMNRAASIERMLGNFERECYLLDQSIESARQTNLPTLLARALAEAAFGAWFASDDKRLNSLLREFERLVEREGIPGLEDLVAAFNGRSNLKESGLETLYWRLVARLVLASAAEDRKVAAAHACVAMETSDAYGDPAWQAIARVVAAEAAAGPRAVLLKEAASFAGQVESAKLQASVESIRRGQPHAGLLGPLMERLRISPALHPRLRLQLSQRKVVVGRDSVGLSNREFELLLALSTHRYGLPRGEILDLLWPDGDETKSRSALNVMVHRLRSRVGGGEFVSVEGDRYMLHSSVLVDLWTAQETWRDFRTKRHLTDQEALHLREAVRLLRECAVQSASLPDWFQPHVRRLAETAQEAATALARRALGKGEIAGALAIAREIVDYDPLDEPAREILIKALLASGDRSGASRELRHYRQLLRTELDAEASPDFVRQLESAIAASSA